MMSQPGRNASAPRLAAPRRKPRRLSSGISLAASLIRSFGSTPGMILRWRMLSPRDHGANGLRHQQRQQDMYDQEADKHSHANKMDIAGEVVAAEQRGQFLELHRLPDRQAGKNDDDAGDDHAGIKQFLHGVV